MTRWLMPAIQLFGSYKEQGIGLRGGSVSGLGYIRDVLWTGFQVASGCATGAGRFVVALPGGRGGADTGRL